MVTQRDIEKAKHLAPLLTPREDTPTHWKPIDLPQPPLKKEKPE